MTATLTAPTTTLAAEHAIFTSIRTPMGEGYRIVATSGGLAHDEKQEITQRSPSHDSLCEPGKSAEGLAAWKLRSGRICVAHSRHAGAEHTARGGMRVYTLIAVLELDTYRALDCDPALVARRVLAAVGREPLLKPPPRLERLDLGGPSDAAPSASIADGGGEAGGIATVMSALAQDARGIAALMSVLAGVLRGERFAAVLPGATPQTLGAVLSALPRCVREATSTTVGLKFATTRPVQAALLPRVSPEASRLIRGQNIPLLDASAPANAAAAVAGRAAAQPTAAHVGWLGWVERQWRAGKAADVARVALQIVSDATPERLGRIVAMLDDLERLKAAGSGGAPAGFDPADVAERYACAAPAAQPEAGLHAAISAALAAAGGG